MDLTVNPIKDLPDLCRFFEVDRPSELVRAVYDQTECGAWINLHLNSGRVLTTNDDDANDWNELGPGGIFLIAFGTIVEGSEAEFTAEAISLPCSAEQVKNALDELEGLAAAAWKEANEDE